MAQNYYDAFIAKLQEIFMMDHAELDFGIYRIMNQKRHDIDVFLETKLLPQVQAALSGAANTNADADRKRVAEILEQLGTDNIETQRSSTMPLVMQLVDEYDRLQDKLANSSDMEELQAQVFSHLVTFFSRYYDGGDFLSKRRYKDNTYAIPYNGEEVKLHWANSDQYYIKTSEYFRDYTFCLPTSHRKVHFVLKDASTEQNNKKNSEGFDRRFIIYKPKDENECILEINEFGELCVNFTYELVAKSIKQESLRAEAFNVISSLLPEEYIELIQLKCPTKKNPERTLLEKHLTDYTEKNSFDYFIHKDLGGFLSRELDFFIKNEVMHIDDLDPHHIQSQLSVVKAIKQVGQKIIKMMAQLENFQRKLWLKKKFVFESNYCITLDLIDDKLYPEIAKNEKQIEEWIRYYEIDSIKGDLIHVGYSKPLTVDFLKQNPLLVVDTANFSESFKHKLLSKIDSIVNINQGLLIYSENFQGLNLIRESYKDCIRGCYIDPPFNLGENADYLYKVDYKDSTWLALIYDRVLLIRDLLDKDGSLFVRCSHDGNMILRQMLNAAYGQDNYRNEIILRRAEETKGDLNKQFETIKSITVNYDNLYWYSKYPTSRFNRIVKPITEDKSNAHWHSFWKAMDRPTMRYSLLGIDLTKHYGQWMWEKNRAEKAVENYNLYQERYESQGVSLEEYWESTGKCLEFVKRDGDKIGSIKYWIPPRTETMADTNWLDIKGYANKWGFKTENSEGVVKRIIDSISEKGDFIIDSFLGSGTTAAVALKTGRRFIGIDMGDHLFGIALPRLKYVLNGETSGVTKSCKYKGGGCFKYIRLEQYEDTLNNLQLKVQQTTTDDGPFHESYMLGYWLDTETRDSLLNLKWFENPFAMTLKATRDNELVETPVDMVETFNFLIGLNVETESWYKDDNICVLTGRTHRGGLKTLVIWRNCKEIDNKALNDFFDRMDFRTRDSEFDVIYVNGDNTLPNLRRDEEHWKVVLIEEEFQNRMFEEE